MDSVKRDLASSLAKDQIITKQSKTISELEGEKHRLLLHLNDAGHIINDCSKEFYNFREQPEIAEVITKSTSNRFKLENPELLYKEVTYDGKKNTDSVMGKIKKSVVVLASHIGKRMQYIHDSDQVEATRGMGQMIVRGGAYKKLTQGQVYSRIFQFFLKLYSSKNKLKDLQIPTWKKKVEKARETYMEHKKKCKDNQDDQKLSERTLIIKCLDLFIIFMYCITFLALKRPIVNFMIQIYLSKKNLLP